MNKIKNRINKLFLIFKQLFLKILKNNKTFKKIFLFKIKNNYFFMSKIPDLELQQTFNYFKKKNESISLQNLIEAFAAIGIILNKEELKEKEKEFESNKGFSFNDYKSIYDRKYAETTKEEILKSFKIFDPDGNGLIKEEQFNRVMTNYGDKFSKNEYKVFMEKYDKVKDGNVHYEEIVDSLFNELN